MNILNAIRKYILAARPAYKDFLGRETKCITIGSLTVNEDSADDNVFFASLSEPSFTGFKAGEIYTVSIDGVESERKGFDLGNIVAIGSGNSIAEIQDDDYGWFVGVYDGHIVLQPMNLDAFVEQYLNKEFIITQTTMEEKWYIKKLPEECIPDSITKTVKRNKQKIATLEDDSSHINILANSAYSMASEARTAANTAKTNAATALKTASAAKEAADGITPDWTENKNTDLRFIRGRTHFERSAGTYTALKNSTAITDEKIIFDGATEDIQKWSINPDGLCSNYDGIKITYGGTVYIIGDNAYAAVLKKNELVIIYRKVQDLPIFLGAIVEGAYNWSLTFGGGKN